MSTIAIVCAMERELQPFTQNWKRAAIEFQARTFRVFEQNLDAHKIVAVAGGIGSRAAELATRAIVEKYRPEVLASTGFAGALIHGLKVGCVIAPNVVVDATNGSECRCAPIPGLVADGMLVSGGEIAGPESKRKLAEKFRAIAVDMEACAVAEVAREAGAGFFCVKAISDELGFPMLPLNQFVGPEGNFLTAKFARWIMLRPRTWPTIIALARNSNYAAKALCDWLKANVTRLR